ncbi:MAG: sigma-70 family RNA polymerase sigma factor [Sphingobacteriaceae bacterium]|nr:MAG: sigma-70 family RNA polymerase sigma factor [Sphingobacteriaceae bacterium]
MQVADNQTNDEKLLLSKISAGDELAFRVLFDLYRSRTYTYALKIAKSVPQAEEILHDVFLKIWLHKNVQEIENLEQYLKTITRNLALNMLRRQQLEVSANLQMGEDWEEGHIDTENNIALNDSARVLSQAVAQLTPQQKIVYQLCKQEGLKYAQVAEQLSISPLTVKTHMQQILRTLRAYLKRYDAMIVYFLLLWI